MTYLADADALYDERGDLGLEHLDAIASVPGLILLGSTGRGGHQVIGQDPPVARIDHGRLGAAREKVLRVAHEVLVQGVAACHQHGVAVSDSARPSPALPETRDRAREACDQRQVETADVYAELERLGGDHRIQLVLEQLALYLATLLSGVAGAVRQHAVGARRVAVLKPPPGVGVDELSRLARGRKADGALPGQHS